MAVSNRIGRILAVLAAAGLAVGVAFVGMCVLIALLGVGLVQTPGGRDVLARGIERLLSGPGGSGVHIGSIAAGLPARLEIDRIEVADTSGTWLTLDHLLFSWEPAALLFGRLHVGELSAQRVAVLRLPLAGDEPASAGPASGPPRLPRPPIGIRVDRIDIGELALAQAVFGRPMRLGIDGRLAAENPGVENGAIRTALSMVPLDGDGGAVLFDASLDPATNVLEVEASIDEPAGGVIGGLLGLPHGTPLAVRLAGHGPLDTWEGQLQASAGGIGRAALRLSLLWTDEIRLETAGRLDVESTLLPQLAPALASGLQVQAAVRQASDGALAVDTVEVAGEGVRLTGNGVVDADDALAFAGELKVEERAIAAGTLGPLRFSAAAVQAVAAGTAQAPTLRANGTVADLVAAGARARKLDFQATAAFAPNAGGAEGGSIDVSGVLDGLHLEDAPLRAALGDSPRFSLAAGLDAAKTRLTLRSLTLDGQAMRLTGSGSLGLEDQRFAARADLAFDDLNAIAKSAGSALSGGAGLTATLEGSLQPPAFTGRLNAGFTRLATGIAAVDALLGPEPRLDAPFSWAQQSGLDMPALRLDARHIAGEGRGGLNADASALEGWLRLTAPALAPLSAAAGKEVSGRAVLTAEVSGNPADPQASLLLRLQDAGIGATKIVEATGELRAAALVTRPNGRLTLEGASDLGPLSASANFALEDGRWLRLDRISARGLGVALDGGVQADLAGPVATGALHAASEAPQAGVRLADTTLRGPLNLDVRLSSEETRQLVSVSLRGGPLSLAQGGEEQLSIGALGGNATVGNVFADPQLTATIEARDLLGPVKVSNARVTADGTPARMRVSLAGEGRGDAPSKLEAGADVSSVGDTVRVDIDRLTGRLAGEAVLLSHPMRVISAPGRLELSGLALGVGSGSFTADARLAPGETAAALRAESLPLRMMRVLSPAAPAHGTLQAELALRTEQAETVGSGRIGLRQVAFDDKGLADAHVDADLDLRLGGGMLQADAAVAGPQGSRLTLAGQLPARLPAGGTKPVVDRAAPIAGRLGIDADLARLSRLLAMDDQRIEGRLVGDLAIGGSLASPNWQGEVNLTDGLYENFVSGTLLNRITGRIEPRDSRSLALYLDGSDGEQGRITVEGEAALDAEGKLRTEVALRADDATLVRRDDVTASLNAQVTYSADGPPAKLAGRIESREIIVRLVDRLPPSVVDLPVTEIGRPRAYRPQPAETVASLALGLDIAVSMPRRVFVRGRGLETEWAGALTVTGTSAAPRVSGEVALVRGTFSFAGKRFTLQRGTVAFTGGKKIDPLINATAEYRSSDITAFITLTGLASDPEIAITSQPPLPESEVLAQVLFGKSSAKLGPVEAVQLAAALEALTRGENTGENALDFVRTLLGLDTLAVQPSRSGEGSSVAVGSYIGDRVYIGAEQGVSDGSQAGTLEIEIAPGISIESEIGQATGSGTQGALGLKWKWDY